MYVHLVDPAAPECTPGVLRCLADLVDVVDGQVVVMGGASDVERCRRYGLTPRALVPRPSWMPSSGVESLRALRGRETPVDSLEFITWSRRADRMTAAAFPGRPRTLVLGAAPAPGDDRDPGPWWRRGTPSRVLALGSAVTQAWSTRGMAARTIAPAAAPPPDRAAARRAVRARWGVADDEFVVGVTVDPSGWGDARMGAEIGHRLQLMKRNARLVVAPDSVDRLLEILRFQYASLTDLLITDHLDGPDDGRFGLDVAVVTSRAPVRDGDSGRTAVPSPCATVALMAAGIPLIAETGHGSDELLDNERTALLVPPNLVAGFVHAALRLCDDRTLARRLADAATEDARRKFSVDAMARAIFGDDAVPPERARLRMPEVEVMEGAGRKRVEA